MEAFPDACPDASLNDLNNKFLCTPDIYAENVYVNFPQHLSPYLYTVMLF